MRRRHLREGLSSAYLHRIPLPRLSQLPRQLAFSSSALICDPGLGGAADFLIGLSSSQISSETSLRFPVPPLESDDAASCTNKESL